MISSNRGAISFPSSFYEELHAIFVVGKPTPYDDAPIICVVIGRNL